MGSKRPGPPPRRQAHHRAVTASPRPVDRPRCLAWGIEADPVTAAPAGVELCAQLWGLRAQLLTPQRRVGRHPDKEAPWGRTYDHTVKADLEPASHLGRKVDGGELRIENLEAG